jgi:hypothetical protein
MINLKLAISFVVTIVGLVSMLALSKIAQANESYKIGEKTFNIVGSGPTRSCKLDAIPSYAATSYDQSAIMVSARGYVKRKDLDNCISGHPVHVYSIPAHVGFLSDINLSKGVYISLDFVSVRPFLYLATVSYIGASKNLVTLDGAYVSGRPMSQLQERAFNTSGEAGASKISKDGRYVAPDGAVSCADNNYPGVWDITNNKRVVLDDDSCSALFDPDQGIVRPDTAQDLTIIRSGSVSNVLRREIVGELKETPYFDEKQNRVLEVVMWKSARGMGEIVTVRAGTEKSAGCAIYEKIEHSGIEFVTGQPYCSFGNPSGHFDKKSASVSFVGEIRQSSDSPSLTNQFTLYYDCEQGLFCHPESRSQKFKCNEGIQMQR